MNQLFGKYKLSSVLFAVMLFITALSGCSTTPSSNKQAVNDGNCGVEISQEDRVKLDLIANQLEQKQYFAALAYLERAPGYPRVLKLKGDAQRNTGQLNEAYQSYYNLSKTCLKPYGHAGMAKVLATRGRVEEARQHMLQARRLVPVDPNIRNDFGFILLAAGDFRDAQREFMTALQLQPDHPVAIRNMVISLILDHDSLTAKQMAQSHGISAAEFKTLIEQANNFRNPVANNPRRTSKESSL